jgi:hypothetical protein
VRVEMEATEYTRWFERLLAELDFEVWIGDPALMTRHDRKILSRVFNLPVPSSPGHSSRNWGRTHPANYGDYLRGRRTVPRIRNSVGRSRWLNAI